LPYDTSTVTVRDVRIRLFRAGSGKPVLFLHGAGGVPAWLPFFDSLAADHDLLVPEHPGFGGSDDPAWIRHVPDVALFYLDFLETVGLKDVHVVGNSLGGWIAAEIAIRDISRFKSLTLLAPAGIRIKGVPVGDNFIWSPEEQARNLFADQAFAELALNAPLTDEQADAMLKNRFAATKYGWQPRWFNPDLEKWLHRIKVPAHVLWGDSDRLLPSAYVELWKERLPDARVTMIKSCGHLPHVEKAEEVSRAVKAFIDGVSA
jgi:pimeloyl-ACP methyl ester carboxylesterase